MTMAPAKVDPGLANRSSSRAGYAIAVSTYVIALAILYVTPKWQQLPFLTEAAAKVVPFVAVAMLTGTLVNLCYLYNDSWWYSTIGDLLNSTIALVAIVRVLQVFPFDFGGSSLWSAVAYLLLGLLGAGNVLAIIMLLTQLINPRIRRISQSPDKQ